MDSLEDLKKKRLKLEERIEHLEDELKKPLKMDPDANALGEENREVLNSLYQVEKENLIKINNDIKKIDLSI
jgi:RNA polymerase-binding transcription factor DksA